jgi:hypothetical protein
MTKRITFILFILAIYGLAKADEISPRYFAVSPGALAEAKARLAAHDGALQPALKALVKAADKALQITPPSVMEKDTTPPSGNKSMITKHRALFLA